MRIQGIRALAAVAAIGWLASCVTDPVTGERQVSVVQWTPEEERELGREYAPNIESQFDAICPDPEANRILGGVVREMVGHSVRKDDFDFHFKVLNSSIPNAFALPGGYVYVTRGLLQNLETEGQFISVMGHELGHVEHRHSMLNQSRGTLLGLPTAPLSILQRVTPVGKGVVGLATAVVQAPSALLGLKFNRGQELEADRRGVFFSAEMDYDPHDGIKTFELFQRMEEEAGSQGLSEYSLFRTHPLNEDRIEGIEETIREEYPQFVGRGADSFRPTGEGFATVLERFRRRAPAYQQFDAALHGLPSDPGPGDLAGASRKLAEVRSLLPDEPLVRITEGELALMQEKDADAVRHFEAAIRLYERLSPGDSHWKPHFYVGVSRLQAGHVDDAIAQLQIASNRFPMNGATHLFLGQAHEQRGDRARAADSYDSAMDLAPRDSTVYEEARRRRRNL